MSDLAATNCGCTTEEAGGCNCGCDAAVSATTTVSSLILILLCCGGCGGGCFDHGWRQNNWRPPDRDPKPCVAVVAAGGLAADKHLPISSISFENASMYILIPQM